MPDIEILPSTLTAAAGPLHDTAQLLSALADDRRGLEHLGLGSPSADLRAALCELVETWELVLWDVASQARGLADELRRCAEDFAQVDNALAHGVAAPAGGWRPLR